MSFADLKIKSGGKFLKIESGEPHEVRLYSEDPVEKIIHGFGKEAEPCGGKGCLRCAEGSQPKQRFLVNVYDHGSQKVLVWEFGGMIAGQLKALAIALKEEGRSLMDVDLKVDATGSSKNKNYTVTPRMTSKMIPTGLVLYKLDASDLAF